MKKIYYGWINVAVLFFTYMLLICPIIFGYGIMIGSMVKSMGVAMTVAALAYTLYALLSGWLQPIAAKFIGKYGVKKSIMLGATFGMVGATVMAIFGGTVIVHYIVYVLCLGPASAFGMVLPHQTGITKWFHRRRGLAMTIVLSSAGVGGYFFPKIIAKVVTNTANWHMGWWVMFASHALAFFLILILYRESPESVGQTMAQFREDEDPVAKSGKQWKLAAFKQKDGGDYTSKEALRTMPFYLITGIMIVCYFVSSSIQTYGASTFVSKGMELTTAASIIATYSLVSLLSRFVAAILMDNVDGRFIMRLGFTLNTIGMCILVFGSGTYTSGVLFAVVFGLGYGLTYVVPPTLTANYYGKKNYASITAIQSLPSTLAAAFSTVVLGAFYDLTNSYDSAWAFALAMVAVGFICAILLKPPVVKSRTD